jgi:predicted MFS family arabinose efflux permease
LAYARGQPSIRVLLTLQAAAWAFVTISIPVELVFAQRSLHAGAGGYAALLSVWGVGAVAGSAVYARWNRLPPRTLIAAGAAGFGVGFVAMAIAPSLAVAIAGAAVAGIGNGIEPVAARTALQERVEQHWMALMMSLSDSIYEAVPGVGILLGGAIVLVSGPREALAVAGAGGLAVTAAVWVVLRPGAGRLEHATAEPAPATSSQPSTAASRAASRPGSVEPRNPAPEGSQAGAS